MNVAVTYTLGTENDLRIDVLAQTTKASPFNVANHTYFNLEGNPANDCYDYQIQIFSNKYIPVGEDIIPQNETLLIPEGDILDFYTKPKCMSKNIDTSQGIFQHTKGYDFHFVLDTSRTINATAYSPKSGIKMEVITDRPIINFYDAHDLDGTMIGKNNIPYNTMCAICFETQVLTDGVNKDNFENTIIKPGQ